MLRKYHKGLITKNLCLTIFCTILITASLYRMSNLFRHYRNEKENILYCYHSKNESLKKITNTQIPENSNSIFFIDSSCKSSEKNRIFLSAKQACAVESAAKLHPNWKIYVLFTAPAVIKFTGNYQNENIIKSVLNYKNVEFLHLNFNYFTGKNELLATHLFHNGAGKLETSTFAFIHASYYLRLFILFKYGGIFLDFDMITLRSLDNLFLNFAGLQSDSSVGNDVLRIYPKAKDFAKTFLRHLRNSYRPHLYQYNGPGALTRMLKSMCNITYVPDLTSCHVFKVYEQSIFYPVSHEEWTHLFHPQKISVLQDKIKNSYTFKTYDASSFYHTDSEKLYNMFTKTYCPNVFKAAEGVVV